MLQEANLYLLIEDNLNFSQKKHYKSLKVAKSYLVFFNTNTVTNKMFHVKQQSLIE